MAGWRVFITIMSDRRVVITGLGAITPIGKTIDVFWKACCEGKSGVTRITNFDPAGYDSQIAGEVKDFDPYEYMSRKEAKRMGRFCQLAVAASKNAMDDSGLDMAKEDPYRIGVFVGSGVGGLDIIEAQYKVLLDKGPQRMSVFTIPALITNMAPGMIAIKFGLKGPNLCIVTACATASHSIGEAYKNIKDGSADVMLAGGTESCIIPMGVGGFCACKALSRRNDAPEKASRPFDRERDGFIMGEGAGVVVLEELERARRRGARIYAEMIGYGANDDAYHMTAPAPNGEAVARCMKKAIENAGISAGDIDYINAHGTSTILNDKYETMSIKEVLGPRAYKVPVSSIKSMTGHLLGAAGAVELISTVLTIRDSIIPPTINYEFPDPECDLDYVPNTARDAEINIALKSSLGFGGHNAVIVIKKFSG